ncbi:SpoIIE family protein phosphatase [Streptomyces sp. MI02-7b]|uniref:SpoIIE family protein phosphatase n=1 Tax=Streptomyces sp. MI02-7b TaxID=462941 RepID=UPI0029A94856|nr:SpoIIE family protein phosphatase [Streptomyces sp. MI02-7b]MDX3077449.1 SpoIIE family protein phosphatase [Streptomyces sp. MI02-7b]
MVSDGAKGRRVRTLSAELALKTLRSGPEHSGRLRSVMEQALVFTGATLVAVYLPAEEGGQLRLAASAGVPRTLYGLRGRYPADGGSPMAVAVRRNRPVSATTGVPDAPGTPAEGEPPEGAAPFDAPLIALPVRAGEDGVGCLVAVTDDPAGFDVEDRQCLELYAGAVACPGQESATDEPPEPPGARPDRGARDFDLAMDTGRIQVDDEVLALFGLAPADFDGRVDTLLALTVPEDLPTVMSVVEAGHMATGERELEFRIRRPSGELRWLRLRGHVVLAPDGRPARLVGTVGDTSRLRSGVNDVGRIQQLATDLSNASTVQEVSQVVATALRGPLGADRIALAEVETDRLVVTVLDPADQAAWPEVWRSEWRTEWPDAPTRSMPTLATALREGRIAFCPPGTPLEPALSGVGPGGLAVLPLPAAGRVVGCCLIGWDTPHEFAPDERAVLTAAAGLAGQALVRVRAFDAEHELVATLQRTLLPRRLPELPGGIAVARYLPTTGGLEVGGDWYDVIHLQDHHVALVIGDVQGHNAGAATLMGQMRTAIRAYAVEGHPPDVVVSHANRLLMGMETDLFATCCYVSIDMEEGSGWCVRAGHLPPVLRLPDGGTETVEGDGGPPLGVIAHADFPLIPLRLRPGTVLALTTDGLVESTELHYDEGMRRLSTTLSGTDPGHLGLMADALLDGATRGDDIALLLMRYDGMAVKPVRESWTVWRLPDAASHARRFTGRTLRSWGLPGDEVDTALLVVSELVTNALVHTDGQVRLDLTLIGDRLRIAVGDASPRTPVKPAIVSWQDTGGRGILLVEAVSTAWGTVPLSGGKQVWSELTVPARPV